MSKWPKAGDDQYMVRHMLEETFYEEDPFSEFSTTSDLPKDVFQSKLLSSQLKKTG